MIVKKASHFHRGMLFYLKRRQITDRRMSCLFPVYCPVLFKKPYFIGLFYYTRQVDRILLFFIYK